MQQQDTASICDALYMSGFARAESVLTRADAAELARVCNELLKAEPTPYSEYAKHKNSREYTTRVYENRDWKIVHNLVGARPDSDAVLEKVYSHPTVRGVLDRVLGPSYKMWQANVRRANPNAGGQDLHQDAVGELGVSILLTDTDRDGATAFLPGSHRWPIYYGDLGFNINPDYVKGALGAATGLAGDVCFFFNRTWHGRFKGVRGATAILSSFFPVGATYPIQCPDDALVAKLPPRLRTLLDPKSGVVLLDNGRARVDGGGEVPERFRPILRNELPVSMMSGWQIVKGWARVKGAIKKVVRSAQTPT